MLRGGGTKVEEVDLGGCSTLSEGALVQFVEALLCEPNASTLQRLSLRRCTHMGHPSAARMAVSMMGGGLGLRRLTLLDLSRIPLSMKSQLPLCAAIGQHPSLRTLRMSIRIHIV